MPNDFDKDARSESSDEEDVAVDKYHRISASTIEPFLEVTTSEFPSGTDRMFHVQSLLTHQAPGVDGQWQAAPSSFMVEWQHNVMLWGIDGVRHSYMCYMDENGRDRRLEWNHRMNALIDAGRFTTASQTMIGDCKNQRLKDSHGSNYFCGDVVVEVSVGAVPPDHGVYGADPIESITRARTVSQAMVDRYGETLAKLKLDHNAAMDLSVFRGTLPASDLRGLLNNMQWTRKSYRIAPYGMTDTMRRLLQSCNYSEEAIGAMTLMRI